MVMPVNPKDFTLFHRYQAGAVLHSLQKVSGLTCFHATKTVFYNLFEDLSLSIYRYCNLYIYIYVSYNHI